MIEQNVMQKHLGTEYIENYIKSMTWLKKRIILALFCKIYFTILGNFFF